MAWNLHDSNEPGDTGHVFVVAEAPTLLIYESSLRAGHGWRESLYRHPGWFKKLLIVGDSAVRLLVTLGARSAW